MTTPITRGYRLRVIVDGDDFEVMLIASDGSVLVDSIGENAGHALEEVGEFLDEEAKLGFPVGREVDR